MSLVQLRVRQQLTQAQLAARAVPPFTQSDVSRAEKRADYRVSTLKRYVEALGGELKLIVKIDGLEYQVAEPAGDA